MKVISRERRLKKITALGPVIFKSCRGLTESRVVGVEFRVLTDTFRKFPYPYQKMAWLCLHTYYCLYFPFFRKSFCELSPILLCPFRTGTLGFQLYSPHLSFYYF